MSLTSSDIAKIAMLSRIKTEPDELAVFGQELSSILHWIDQLEKVDVSSIDSLMSQELMTERADEVTDGNKVDAIIANAPESAHNMFTVPKVVE